MRFIYKKLPLPEGRGSDHINAIIYPQENDVNSILKLILSTDDLSHQSKVFAVYFFKDFFILKIKQNSIFFNQAL